MNRKTLILFLILLCLIGIPVVSASTNVTDNAVNLEDSGEIHDIHHPNQQFEDESSPLKSSREENLTISDNNETLSTKNNSIICITNDNETITKENNNVVTVTNDNGVLKTSINKDEKISSRSYGSADKFTKSKTQYKTITLGKALVLKKYMAYKYNAIPKKIKYFYMKQMVNLKKTFREKFLILAAGHWHKYKMFLKPKFTTKYFVVAFKIKVYRTYNYNPVLNKRWWD